MAAGHVERDLHRVFRFLSADLKFGNVLLLCQIRYSKIRIFGKTVSDFWPGYAWQYFAHYRVIDTKYGQAIKREIMEKIDKVFLQVLEVTPISAHMIRFYVGDHCYHWLQMHKGSIALVSLSHQVSTLPQPRVSARTIQQASDHKSWIETSFRQYRGNDTCCRRLAVGAGNRNGVAIAHQLRQHLSPRDQRLRVFDCLLYFRISLIDGTRINHNVGILYIFRIVAEKDFRPHRC